MARLSVRFILDLLKQTAREWIEDEVPQLGAALAFYSVFSLAPMVLIALALIGFFGRNDPAGVWSLFIQQWVIFWTKARSTSCRTSRSKLPRREPAPWAV